MVAVGSRRATSERDATPTCLLPTISYFYLATTILPSSFDLSQVFSTRFSFRSTPILKLPNYHHGRTRRRFVLSQPRPTAAFPPPHALTPPTCIACFPPSGGAYSFSLTTFSPSGKVCSLCTRLGPRVGLPSIIISRGRVALDVEHATLTSTGVVVRASSLPPPQLVQIEHALAVVSGGSTSLGVKGTCSHSP